MEEVKEKFTYKKSMRLLKRNEFKEVQRVGVRLSGKFMYLRLCSLNQGSQAKLGITVTKRFGKAHERNRFKRVLREIFRLSYPTICASLVIEAYPLPSSKKANFHEIQADFISLISSFHKADSTIFGRFS